MKQKTLIYPLEKFDDIVSNYKNDTGIPPPYVLQMTKQNWDSFVKEHSLNKILSMFRRNEICGADVFANYGIKKIRIWLNRK